MNCKFSETQFSFCFTFEYIRRYFPFVPLPIFPNIVNEGRVGGGYDVKIKGNLFFQFKIPTFHNKLNTRNQPQWNIFSKPYYRIKINTNGKQYKLLKDLQGPGRGVFYATPNFHTVSQLTGSIVFDNQQTNIHLSVKPSWTVIIFTIIWCGLIIIGLLFGNQSEFSSVSNTLYHILIWFIWTFIPIGLAKLKVHWDRQRLENWLDKKINHS